jgi:hypothetical protein
MPTNHSVAEHFYAIWWPLLFFVNETQRLVPHVRRADDVRRLPVPEVNKIRHALWADDQLRGNFIEQNPANLADADLTIVADWNHRRAGKFFIFRHLKSHSIFIDDRSPAHVYAVHGLYSLLSEVTGPYLPVLAEVVLLPFEERIIYDGVIAPYNITFGSGIRGNLNDLYRDAKERAAIITSLLPSAAAPDRDMQLATIQSINAKVLAEFRTYLYRSGLSAKVVERDIAAVEDFAKADLVNGSEPRSLRDIGQADVTRYLPDKPATAFTSFKRFIKFMAETNRLDWGEAESTWRWLRGQK